MTLADLQASWYAKAAGYRVFAQSWLDSLKAQGIEPPKYIHDECADALTPHIEHEAKLESEVQRLRRALEAMLRDSVVLSEEYLASFASWPADSTISGFSKEQWLRLAATAKQARAALKDSP